VKAACLNDKLSGGKQALVAKKRKNLTEKTMQCGLGSSLLLTHLSECEPGEAARRDRAGDPDERPDYTGISKS
jgi:hypothetical protein